MGFRLDGFVGTNTMADGNAPAALTRFGRDGSMVVAESHGKFYEQASRGNMYVASSATGGAAIVIVGNNIPTLWNPMGSGVNAEIVRIELAWVSGATAPTALSWVSLAPAGATIATGAPIATATLVATANCLVGGGKVGAVKWAPIAITFTAAPVFFTSTGIGLGTGAPTVVPSLITKDYDGMLVIPPGSALSLVSQAATTTALYTYAIYYVEQSV
jgi:hypothetical protein